MGHSSTAEKEDKFRYVILNTYLIFIIYFVGTYPLYEVKDRGQKKVKKKIHTHAFTI